MGLGIYPASHHRFLGMLGMHGTYQANMAMHNADLIIAIGARFDDRITNKPSKFAPNAKVVHLDVDHSSVSKIIEANVAVFGQVKNSLKLIKEILQDAKISKEAWQLNERHYGALTGLNKDEMKIKLGEEKVHQFRRSWDLRPDPLDKNNPYHPINIETYKEIPINKIPDTESLKDTYERVIQFYMQEIENKISKNNILISAHGNSIRALCKYLFKLDENQVSKLEIPTGNPLLITLDGNKKITDCKYLDSERAKDLVVF